MVVKERLLETDILGNDEVGRVTEAHWRTCSLRY